MAFNPGGTADWAIDQSAKKSFGYRTDRLCSNLADWLRGDLAELAASDVTEWLGDDISLKCLVRWNRINLLKSRQIKSTGLVEKLGLYILF